MTSFIRWDTLNGTIPVNKAIQVENETTKTESHSISFVIAVVRTSDPVFLQGKG